MTSVCLLEKRACHASSPGGGGAPQQGDASGSHWQQQGCVLLALSITVCLVMAGSLALREVLRKISSSSPPSYSSYSIGTGGIAGWPNVAQHCYAGGSFLERLQGEENQYLWATVTISFFWKLKIDSVWAVHRMVWPYVPGIFSLCLFPGSSRPVAWDYAGGGRDLPTCLTMNALDGFPGRSG